MNNRAYRHLQKDFMHSLYINGHIDSKPMFKIGYVESCNPNTFTVDVKVDRLEVVEACPILNLVGRTLGTDLVWLQSLRGAYVILINIVGVYHVLSTLPTNTAHRDEFTENVVGVSDLSLDTEGYEQTYSRDYNQNRPNDFLQDDKIIRAEDGVELGLLKGGIAKLKASPLAQLVLGKIKDFARLVARRFSIFCDFGEINSYQNDEGRTTLHIAGGASFHEETHPGQKNWTVQAWLGDYPANEETRFMLQTNSVETEDPDEHEYTVQSANVRGQIFVETSDDMAHQVGKDYLQYINHNKLSRIEENFIQECGADFQVEAEETASITGSKGAFIFSEDACTMNAGKTLTLIGGDEARLSSSRTVNIFAGNEVKIGVDNMNNVKISPQGIFITDDGDTKKPFFLPGNMLGGTGPIQTGITGSMGGAHSVGAAAAYGEIPGEIGKEGDLVISLSALSMPGAGGEEGEEASDESKAIYIAASPSMYIKIDSKKIEIRGSDDYYIELSKEGIKMKGHLAEQEGP